MITERAIIFDKINLRYARSIVLYALPESPDTLTDALLPITEDARFEAVMKVRLNLLKNTLSKGKGKSAEVIETELAKETVALSKERKVSSMSKAVVGLFSKFDTL